MFLISRHILKTLLHYRVKHKSLKMLQLLHQFLMTQMCQTFMITLWIVNRFEKHILWIWNIVLLLQWPLTQLAYCQSSKWPLARRQARRSDPSIALVSTSLCWAVPNVQQFLNVVNSWLIHALLDNAVNK